MTSSLVEYRVECAPGKPELVKTYLDYTDWAARLSFITRRNSILPDVRIAVNDELRRRSLLPIKVSLTTLPQTQKGLHVKADHKFVWQLNGDNKSTITHWDEMTGSNNTKVVPWGKYYGPDIARK
jgi:hypothetical protein